MSCSSAQTVLNLLYARWQRQVQQRPAQARYSAMLQQAVPVAQRWRGAVLPRLPQRLCRDSGQQQWRRRRRQRRPQGRPRELGGAECGAVPGDAAHGAGGPRRRRSAAASQHHDRRAWYGVRHALTCGARLCGDNLPSHGRLASALLFPLCPVSRLVVLPRLAWLDM